MPLFSRENGVFGEIMALCIIKLEKSVRFRAAGLKIMAQMSLFHPNRGENEKIMIRLSLFRPGAAAEHGSSPF
jgi:hypothetical protein